MGRSGRALQAVGMAELVDEPLGPFSLLHDTFLVVLTDGAGKLVIVHGWAVLAFAPQASYPYAVFNLENALLPVQPADARAIELRLLQQLLQELPQVDVGATAPTAATTAAATATDLVLRLFIRIIGVVLGRVGGDAGGVGGLGAAGLLLEKSRHLETLFFQVDASIGLLLRWRRRRLWSWGARLGLAGSCTTITTLQMLLLFLLLLRHLHY